MYAARKIERIFRIVLMMAVLALAPTLAVSALETELSEGTSQETATLIPKLDEEYYFTRRVNAAKDRESWFKFQVPSNVDGYFWVYVSNNDDDQSSVDYEIRTGAGKKLSSGWVYRGSTASREFYSTVGGRAQGVMEAGETYYLVIWDINPSKKAGIKISFTPDGNANEKQYAETIHENIEYRKTLDCVNDSDYDYFKYVPTETGNQRFVLKNIESSNRIDYNIRKWGSDELITDILEKKVSGWIYSGGTATWDVYLEEGQPYYITISGRNKAVYLLNISNTKVVSINLSKTAVTATAGDAFTLNATVSPSNAYNPTITWYSSNTDVATVDGSGNVRTGKAGVATIRVSATDGSNISATCIVSVKPKKIENISINSNTKKAVKLSWYANGDVDGYQVGVYNKSTRKYDIYKKVKKTSAIVKGLTAGTTYKFCVIPYTGSLKGKTAVVSTTTLPDTSQIIKAVTTKSDSYNVTKKISWKKISGASGYNLLYCSQKSGSYYTLTGEIRKTSSSVERSKGTTMYVKVQAYRIYNGQKYYGALSKAYKVNF